MALLVPQTPLDHMVHFRGRIVPYTSGMPDSMVYSFDGAGQHHFYVSAWIDGKRGTCARVGFQADRTGVFEFSLPIRNGDPDALKLQVGLRMCDDETGNRRTAELYMSYARLGDMLRGVEDSFCMRNQFDTSTYAKASVCVVNASDFQNFTGLGACDACKPMLTLRTSDVSLVSRVNEDMKAVSDSIQGVMRKLSVRIPTGGDGFCDGMTRFFLSLYFLVVPS